MFNQRLPYLLFLIFFGLAPVSTYAVTNLSVNPVEGGNSLRFGRVDNQSVANKEARIRIISNDGKQYQIFQRILEPLVNERGYSMNPSGITTYTLNASNSAGTLYVQEPTSFGYSDQLLYTSNPNGDSDSFQVVYNIDKNKIEQSGDYLGKLQYVLRPIGAGSVEDAVLNMSFEVSKENKFTIEGSSGKQSVKLSTHNGKDQTGYVKIGYEGNPGDLRIYQDVLEFPHNELDEDLLPGSLVFSTHELAGDQGQLSYLNPVSLERKHQLLYSASENSGSFIVDFALDDKTLTNQKAGYYRGKIRYTIEKGDRPETVDFDLNIEVTPIFNLDVQYPSDGLRFSKLLPGTPSQIKEIKVVVNTNLGKPFMVTQNINSSLTSEKGEKIPSDAFRMKIEVLEGQTGKTEFNDFSAVPSGTVPILFSDIQGTLTTFRVLYQLSPYPEMQPGDYNLAVMYSLSEM